MSAAPWMKSLSRPLSELRSEYAVVVVGSGYGAAVAASRLARAGQRVCVLERGREIRPGEYPDGMTEAAAEMQVDTSRGKLGSANGMFNVHVNDDMWALVGCGLGGTSLINANVALEMDPRQFERTLGPEDERTLWPKEFTDGKAPLEQYTRRALRMLDAKPYPDDFPPLNKLQALQMSAQAMKQPFCRPPIAVNFRDQVNSFGVAQPRCTLCGDCTSGCNDGAKNTTLMNYLPDAHKHGAEIFTRTRVSHVERDGKDWRVHFSELDQKGTAVRIMSVRARVVVLGAGSLGSTEILLRSRKRGLPLSARLGHGFSGNGDVLGFGYNNHWQEASDSTPKTPRFESINGIGRGSNTLSAKQRPGPCITGVIDMRNAPRVEDGLVIEEGVIPGAVAGMIAPGAFMADALFGNFLQYGTERAAARLLEAQEAGEAIMNTPGEMVQMAYAGPAARTQTYLVMSVDAAAGALRLDDEERLRIDWPGAGRARVIARDNRLLRQANNAIQGHFIPNPLWTEAQGYKLITVHPLGGCGMGDDATLGVVNHKCQVFAAEAGSEVHAGLYVCDGAVLPGAAGVNPLLTISAVAERACDLMAQERSWSIDYAMDEPRALLRSDLRPGPQAVAPVEARHGLLARFALRLLVWTHAIDLGKVLLRWVIGRYPNLLSPAFQFTERMHGYVSTRPVARDEHAAPSRERIATDFDKAAAWGRAADTPLSFELTIRTENLHNLTENSSHCAAIIGAESHPGLPPGTVICRALSQEPMRVLRGQVNLLPVDPQRVETWSMTYDMVLEREGGPVRFQGFKVLHQQPGSHWWDDVTTLFITLHAGERGEGGLLAQGTLKLNLEDLMWQGASGRLDSARGKFADLVNRIPAADDAIKMLYMAKFAGFFGGVMFKAYGGVLSDMKNYPAAELKDMPRRALIAPVAKTHRIALSDGFSIRLTRYQGGKQGPVILAPGFSVKASSFAINTVKTNLVEYLTAHDFDVWLFDYRASPDSGSPMRPFTIDDIARIDWPAAVDFVCKETGNRDVQVLAHCVGSMSLLMGLLAPGENQLQGKIRSVISSALTLHPVTNWLSYLKVDIDAVRLLQQMSELGGKFNIVPGDTLFERKIDFAAWNVPVPEGEECRNPVCRRVFAIFGPSYAHAQLDHATHTAMQDMFSDIAIAPFEHLSLIMQRQRAVDCSGEDCYLADDRARNLALPISFVTGALNRIFVPETIARTYRWLVEKNGADPYDCHVFEGYAHMDMFIGRNAAADVYPHLLERLERYAVPGR